MIDTTAALERAQKAWQAEQDAKEASTAASAELARVKLLNLAEQFPQIEGYDFEIEYEYNDEGGYDPYVRRWANVGGSAVDGEDVDEVVETVLIDLDLNEDIVELLADDGVVTVEQLKEKSF